MKKIILSLLFLSVFTLPAFSEKAQAQGVDYGCSVNQPYTIGYTRTECFFTEADFLFWEQWYLRMTISYQYLWCENELQGGGIDYHALVPYVDYESPYDHTESKASNHYWPCVWSDGDEQYQSTYIRDDYHLHMQVKNNTPSNSSFVTYIEYIDDISELDAWWGYDWP